MGENDGRKAYREVSVGHKRTELLEGANVSEALGIWERQEPRSVPVETQGTWHLAPITPASWARIKAAGTAVMGSLLPPALLTWGLSLETCKGLAESSRYNGKREATAL